MVSSTEETSKQSDWSTIFPAVPQLTDKEFQLFRDLIYDSIRINLNDSKRALLANRLLRRLRLLNLSSYTQYYDLVTSRDEKDGEFQAMIDAITTNKTEFFRELNQWAYLEQVIWPALAKEPGRSLRIWSAACSTGEEPYSILIHMFEHLPDACQRMVTLVASDVSVSVLRTAERGIYDASHVETIPFQTRRRYFLKGNGRYRVKPELRSMVSFRRINLAEPLAFSKESLDMVFCRNALIYFDRTTQSEVISQFHHVLQSGGYLFLGHAESLSGTSEEFKFLRASIYRK